MTLAIDASSPASVHQNGTAAVVTASFNCPAGAFVTALLASDSNSGAVTYTVTGGSLTWAVLARVNTQPGDGEVQGAFNPTAQSMTVSATPAGAGSGAGIGNALTVLVFTGAEQTWGGASNTGASGTGMASVDVTTTTPNSFVIAAISDNASTVAPTPGTGITLVDSYVLAGHYVGSVLRTTNVVAAAGVQTIGTTAPAGQNWNEAAVEIRESNVPFNPAHLHKAPIHRAATR